jgi:hypothetical protein
MLQSVVCHIPVLRKLSQNHVILIQLNKIQPINHNIPLISHQIWHMTFSKRSVVVPKCHMGKKCHFEGVPELLQQLARKPG